MSLFSTIAHDGATPARGFSPKRVGIAAVGIALGITVGFVIATNRTADLPQQTTAAVNGLAYEDFYRLNTTDLDGLVPAVAAAVTESQGIVDPFVRLNTTDLDGLVPAVAAAVTESQGMANPNFWYLNTTALEYPAAKHAEQPSGPR